MPSAFTPTALRALRDEPASMPSVVMVLLSISSLPPTAYCTSVQLLSFAAMDSVTSSPTAKSTHEGTLAPSDLVSTIWFLVIVIGLLPVPLFTTFSLTEPFTLTGVSSTRSRIMFVPLAAKCVESS